MTLLPSDLVATGPRVWVDTFLARFDALDRLLQGAGFPPTSPWWRAEIERFFRSGRRRWVIRAGRRAGKSSTLCRVAVCWAHWGPWSVPAGDVAVIAFLSIDRDEASARLRTIREILSVLGVQADARSDEIELIARRVVFKVATSSIRGVVGFTSVLVLADEMARWESRDTAANPAREVMGSLRPTMATQPLAFEVCSSSPWSIDDYHAELFDAGDTDHQVTSFAATWTANPTITEARTHELEPDGKVHSREYAAVPSSALSSALDPDAIAAAQRPLGPGYTLAAPVVCLDFSSGRGDAVAWSLVRWCWTEVEPEYLHSRHYVGHGIGDVLEPVLDAHGDPIANPAYTGAPAGILLVQEIRSLVGSFWGSISSPDLVARIARDCSEWGAKFVIADQHSSYALEGLFKAHAIGFASIAWTNPNKVAAVERIRRWLRDKQIVLPVPVAGRPSERLSRELHAFQEKLLPSGTITYGARTGAHDDHVATLITAAIADSEQMLPVSPTTPRRSAAIDYSHVMRVLRCEADI